MLLFYALTGKFRVIQSPELDVLMLVGTGEAGYLRVGKPPFNKALRGRLNIASIIQRRSLIIMYVYSKY